MTARVALQAAVLLSALLLQTVLFPSLAIAGFRPDLVTLTVIAFALADGADTGIRYGFVAGLTTDLLSGESHIVGLSALVLLLVGWTVGMIRPYLSGTAWFDTIAVAVAAGAGGFALYGLLALLLDLRQFTVTSLVQGTLAVALWNLALAPLVCRPIASLSHRFTHRFTLADSSGGTGATRGTGGTRG
ncbi:MAG: rod shape-determining protein MreD, partial [Egibacteraceae bacterium]